MPSPRQPHAPTPEDLAYHRLIAYTVATMPGYRDERHHRLIARKLEQVERGEIKRLIIEVPPRHGKSELASTRFPAWYLGRNPTRQIIHTMYEQGMAEDFGRKVRNQLSDPYFQAIFPGVGLSKDSTAAKRFNTTAGGVYTAVGMGGAVTGRGAHVFLIDDPLKGRAQADSETIREGQKDWYRSVAYTRLMPGGAIVLVLTHWHEDDLAGWLMREHAAENWEVVKLPAIAEKDDLLGRTSGEALWPSDYPVDRLMGIKAAIGSREWSALYQQRPVPQEGGIVKLGWFGRYDEPPANLRRRIQSWDTASKKQEIHDWSACTTWAETLSNWCITNGLRKKMEYPELKRVVISHAMAENPDAILIEDKGHGTALIQDLRESTRLPVIPVMPCGDKVLRMSTQSPLIESGRVLLPRFASWLVDFEADLCTFPLGAHDDYTDTVSQALDYLRGSSIEFKSLTAPRESDTMMKGY